MYDEKIVLCGANSYEQRYYLNPDFDALPDNVKDELKVMYEVRAKALTGNMADAKDLVEEMLFGTKLTDEKRLHEVLSGALH